MAFLITMIPAIVFLIILLYQMLRGYMRGQRKSLYLFINMVVAMVFTLIAYISFNLSLKGNTLLSFIPGFESGLGDAVEDTLGYVMGEKTEGVILAYVQLIMNFFYLIILQLFIYPFAKAIGYVIYLIIFRRKVIDDKDEGNLRRFGGLGIGAVRGLIIGFLIFSQFSTLYYVLAGGVFYTSDEYDELNFSLEIDDNEMLDEIYKGIKISRTTGVGAVFDKLSIGGTSLDYLYIDLLVSGTFSNYADDTAKVTLRKDIGNIIGIAALLYETGAVTLENGEFVPNMDKITPDTIQTILNQLMDTTTITDSLPTVVIDLAVMYSDELGINLTYEDFAKLDVKNDIEMIGDILTGLINIIQYESSLEFEGIDWYGLDAEEVDKIIQSASEITFLTEVMLPLGVGMIGSQMDDLVFNLDSILWNEEIQNLKGLYGMLQELELENGFSDLTNDLGNIFLATPETEEEKLEQEAKIAVFDQIISQIFDSKLVYQVAVGSLEVLIMELSDDPELIETLDFDISKYTHDDLKSDVSLLTTSFVDGFSIYQQLQNSEDNETSFFDMDMTLLKELVLGVDHGNDIYEGGILNLKLLTKCMNQDAFFSMYFEATLGSEIALPDGLNWRNEFSSMFDVVITIQESDIPIDALLEGDITALSELSLEDREKITDSLCDSIIITSIFVSTLTKEDSELSFLEIPANVDWYGDDTTDGEIKHLLNAIFHITSLEDVMDDFTNGDMSTIFSKVTDDDLDILLASQVLTATLSVQFDELGTESFLIIPDNARDNSGYITSKEIKSLFKVVRDLDIEDITKVDINEIEILSTNNIELMTSSLIMSATLVNELILVSNGSLEGVIFIPNGLGDYTDAAWYGEDGELVNLLYSLQAIFGEDATLGTIGDIDLNDILDNKEVMLESIILTYTISEILSDLDVLSIPSSCYETVSGSRTITKTEISNLLTTLEVLGFTDFDNISADAILSNNADYDVVFASNIFRATASDTITKTSGEAFVISQVNMDSEGYMSKDSLVDLFDGLAALNLTSTEITDFEALLSDSTAVADALESSILQDTFSKTILSLDLNIPSYYYDTQNGAKVVLITDGTIKDINNNAIYTIDDKEILALINVINTLSNTDSMSDLSNVKLEEITALDDTDKQVILSSYTMCAQLSDILINLPGAPQNSTISIAYHGSTTNVAAIDKATLTAYFIK